MVEENRREMIIALVSEQLFIYLALYWTSAAYPYSDYEKGKSEWCADILVRCIIVCIISINFKGKSNIT